MALESKELRQTSTEAYTPSIVTKVMPSVCESATEITRIPRRTYREYIEKHNPEDPLPRKNPSWQRLAELLEIKMGLKTEPTTTQPPGTITALANTRDEQVHKVKIEYYETTLNIDTDEEARVENAPFARRSTTCQILGPAQYLGIHSRNNSKFFKNLHETFENWKDRYVPGYQQQNPLTAVEITRGVNESKIKFDVQIRYENDTQDSPWQRLNISKSPVI